MRSLSQALLTVALVLAAHPASAQSAAIPLAQRIVHYDATKVRECAPCHLGQGAAMFFGLLSPASLDAPLNFLHRGYIAPKSSIGHHFHNRAEEMFFIFDGEAQFTVDGRTSTIKGPAAVPVRMGHAHAIYNATDKPVSWMNVQVVYGPGSSAFDLGDTRVSAALDPVPVFMSTRFDRALLRPVEAMRGGKGVAQYRRAFDGAVFSTAWSYVDHIVLPPGASIGPQATGDIAEIIYVMAGSGVARVGGETAPIRALDVAPIRSGETHGIENTGDQPLEMIVVGIAKDLAAKEAFLATPRPTRPPPRP
ncbi:MAG: mannose-6-phosphate isomerase [Caulobacterales bacterium 68-7]|nr:MAG: mannose-6-phosphate isomerase [Caulobacterales bacterium 68-7]